MGMKSLLRKVFLLDLLQGLKVTFMYQDPKEIYTEQYPMERPQVAERYRGAPRLNVNPDTDETMCIACDRRLSRGRPRTHPGLRTRQLHPRRLDLGPRDPGKGSAAYGVSEVGVSHQLKPSVIRADKQGYERTGTVPAGLSSFSYYEAQSKRHNQRIA